jgi:hypothetical protein
LVEPHLHAEGAQSIGDATRCCGWTTAGACGAAPAPNFLSPARPRITCSNRPESRFDWPDESLHAAWFIGRSFEPSSRRSGNSRLSCAPESSPPCSLFLPRS